MSRDRRGRSPSPRPVSGTIGKFLERYGPRDTLSRVQGAWRPVAGETIAAATRVVAESEGTVEIECESSVWAEELTLMEPRLRGLLNDQLGPGEPVRELRFRPVDSFRGAARGDC